jgi:hypothetical protein
MRNFLIGFLAKTLFLLAVIIAVFGASQTFSEEWSAAQKEVWKMQEKHWQVWKEKGGESLPPFYHKKSVIWGATANWPSEFGGGMCYDGLGGLIDSFELKPHEVRVFGDLAIIMYESKVIFVGKPYRLRCTDIWMKQEGKWQIIGAMHDSCSELPPCP